MDSPASDRSTEASDGGPGLGLEAAAQRLAGRVFRRRLRLAVTGLSRAGKTAFLTALLHNLGLAARLGEGHSGHLPFFEPVARGLLDDVALLPLHDLPPFPFAANLRRLTEGDRDFPPGTRGLSGFAAALEYRPRGALRHLVPRTSVRIEVVDYPGEWLLDLPMLEQSFASWSAEMLRLSRTGARAHIGGAWRELSADAPAGEEALEAARLSYVAYLAACRAAPHHLSDIQPGRFLHSDDDGGDVSAYRFCPLSPPAGAVRPGSVAEAMAQRFERYKREIVRPFYTEVFSGFDRQLVLVDVIGALNAGPEAFHDMRRALAHVLRSFRREEGGILARLLGRRADRVLFAATKADHVTANQFHNLRLLLRAMMADGAALADEQEFAAVAAVKCTSNRRVQYQGQQITVLEGVIKGHDEAAQLFPGEIPEHLPSEQDWRSERFRFYEFRPPPAAAAAGRGIPHIHMDKVLQFLTGDLFW